jgi:hypothetical protein
MFQTLRAHRWVVLATVDKSQHFFASIFAGKIKIVGACLKRHLLARLGPQPAGFVW